MVSDHVRDDALRRLRRISGQVEGLTRMLGDGRPAPDVLVQFNAAEAALRSAAALVLQDHLRDLLETATGHDVADAMAGEVLKVFEGMRPK